MPNYDAIRQSSLLDELLQACLCDAQGRRGHEGDNYLSRPILIEAQRAAARADVREIVAKSGDNLPQRIDQARIAAIAANVREVKA